jgi:peptide/nickel transport system substrate-binding protein
MRARSIRWAGLAALAATAGLILSGCGGGPDDASGESGGSGGSPVADLAGPATFGTPEAGGTYRLAQTDFGFTSAFDPSGEYLGTAWNIYSNLMLRTLVSYPFTAGSAGNEPVPDLATEVPEPTDGGTVYTFTLKDGVTFGPPLNRPITSRDVAYAFERIATPSVAAQYGFYYEPIEGFDAFASGEAETISGITTPDDRTIRFTLTEPVGDFPYRLAMPATAAIPPEVGGCHENAGAYGRYIIASGPYMIEGSEKLDATSCATQRPISGFNPTSRLSLVRNPSYDPASDDTSIRRALPDSFLFTINSNEKDIFDKIAAGELESSFDAPPPDILRSYVRGDDATRERLRVNQGDRLWYIYMNLTTPPFDDVHVRRALNMAVDLDGLRRAWGGPVAGDIATDVIPDAMLGDELTSENYQPFQGPPFAGDIERAKEEMALSKYDTDKDGVCDAPACKNVVHITQNFGPWAAMAPVLDQSAAAIGITLDTRQLAPSASYAATGNVSREVPIGSNGGWSKDFADPSTFMTLHDGRTIIPTGNTNSSLVGLTADQAGELGVAPPAGGVPSVDADIDACTALSGAERQACWVDLSKRVTEEVVPWIPYLDASNLDLLGPAVTGYDYDQFSGEQSLARAAVDPSLQK